MTREQLIQPENHNKINIKPEKLSQNLKLTQKMVTEQLIKPENQHKIII